jgi:cation diffusion facilitator CzcD-associated flavoprotein CzcO
MSESSYDAVVIGAGMSGICAAIDLERAGTSTFRVFEKADDVGGTWRDNRYPGVACDVPSHLYSYSFEPNPDWSKWYGTGQEIWDYIRRCADKYRVRERITFGTAIRRARWEHGAWHLTSEHGEEIRTRMLVTAMGGLHTPYLPDLPGRDDFAGPAFHTSAWRDDVCLDGLRVAVIGTGATAVQVVPELARRVGKLFVFQRSPVWVGAKKDPAYSAEQRAEFAADPTTMRRHRWQLWKEWEANGVDMATAGTWVNVTAERRARELIERSVADPQLRAALTPNHNFTCKRPTLSNDYYATFAQPHVQLVTAAVERVERDAVVSAGRRFAVDAIVYATGFKPMDITHEIDVRGLGRVSLREAWQERIASYRSVMVRGFPNLFVMMGPNSAGLTSALQMIEQQSKYIVRAIAKLRAAGIAAVHPKQDSIDAFSARLEAAFKRTTHSKGCTSWWRDEHGYNHSIWPESSVTYRMLLADMELRDFDTIAAATPRAEASGRR